MKNNWTLLVSILVFLSACQKKIQECDNSLLSINHPDCSCPKGSFNLHDIDNGKPDTECSSIHEWAQYASGMEQANSWLNDSVVFVFNYYHFATTSVNVTKPYPFFNSKAYIQQMNTKTRVSEGKIGNVEVLVSRPDTSKPKELLLVIDLRGKVGNTYDGDGGIYGYMTDANLQKYGWNEATGEGIILRGKLNHGEARFYDWEIGFTAAGDSTSFNIIRSVPMEFKAMIGE